MIGKANLRTVGLFQQRARSQAPFLHRHYPASTVVRTCPPPHTAEPAPHGVLVESHDLSPLGLPVFRRSPLPDMPTPLPRRNLPMLSLSPRAATAFPLTEEGLLPPLVIFEACSAFTHVSACLFARSPKVTFTRVFQRMSLPPCAALIASGRATDWPGGIRTHWRSPTFTAYWIVDRCHVLMSL